MKQKVTVFGGAHHREKIEIHRRQQVINIATIKPFNIMDKDTPSFRSINEDVHSIYIRHDLYFGDHIIEGVYLENGIDPMLWAKNIVLDYICKND